MAQTPEGKVKDVVKEELNHIGAYWHMPVQNGMGRPSLDFNGCYKGMFFAIETKAPGKEPTPRQLITIREIEQAGGLVFVIDSVDAARVLGVDIMMHWSKHHAK